MVSCVSGFCRKGIDLRKVKERVAFGTDFCIKRARRVAFGTDIQGFCRKGIETGFLQTEFARSEIFKKGQRKTKCKKGFCRKSEKSGFGWKI